MESLRPFLDVFCFFVFLAFLRLCLFCLDSLSAWIERQERRREE
jgi:hypothetical protein